MKRDTPVWIGENDPICLSASVATVTGLSLYAVWADPDESCTWQTIRRALAWHGLAMTWKPIEPVTLDGAAYEPEAGPLYIAITSPVPDSPLHALVVQRRGSTLVAVHDPAERGRHSLQGLQGPEIDMLIQITPLAKEQGHWSTGCPWCRSSCK